MGLVTTKEMFEKAYKGKYAVGAFNVNNMEIVQGIVEAAKIEKAPVILQVSNGARKYAGAPYLRHLVEAAIEDSGIDLVLHLDHGSSFELCKQCVDDGFSSVMIDASKLPLEENIKETKKVVEYAHDHGVVVEAELGKLSGVEDEVSVEAKDALFTDPEEAKYFVEQTGVDSLAIAIGTSHGAYKYKGEPYLDFERLEKIEKLLPGFPLVLHGASSVPQDFVKMNNEYGGKMVESRGVSEELLAKASKMGIVKINIDTDIRIALTASIRKALVEDPGVFDPRVYFGNARDAVRDMVIHKMRDVLGCSGKA